MLPVHQGRRDISLTTLNPGQGAHGEGGYELLVTQRGRAVHEQRPMVQQGRCGDRYAQVFVTWSRPDGVARPRGIGNGRCFPTG
jgi:hypothetical protein